MSMTAEVRREHERYEKALPHVREMVDEAMEEVRKTFRGWGCPQSNTDAAEVLVAAIHAYAMQSVAENPESNFRVA
jgi:hypothetical protein